MRRKLSAGDGGYTPGGHSHENFYNAFLCIKRCPWTIRRQKLNIATFAAKNGGYRYTPGGYTPDRYRITVAAAPPPQGFFEGESFYFRPP